jgi:hypothetical protein
VLPHYRQALADAGRRAALGFGAAVLLLIGLAFLTVAAWLALAALRDPLFAALVIGLVYLGLGLILLAMAGRRAPPPPPPDPATRDDALRAAMAQAGLNVPPKGEFPPLIESFLFGLIMALKLRRGDGGDRG